MIKLFVVDVDGTLTDGSIIYDDNGREYKRFNTRDGAGFFALKQVGIEVMTLTGRQCDATEKRMKEMRVDYIFQNVYDKADFLKSFCVKKGYSFDEVGYVGDELNDVSAMRLCGFVGCPIDACREVREIANYVSTMQGGNGAFRDVVEFYLRKIDRWEDAVALEYNIECDRGVEL